MMGNHLPQERELHTLSRRRWGRGLRARAVPRVAIMATAAAREHTREEQDGTGEQPSA